VPRDRRTRFETCFADNRALLVFIVRKCSVLQVGHFQNPKRFGILEIMKRKNPHAVALGRLGGKLGGRVKSEAKTKAAQENGRLGGRPRRPGPEEDIEREVREAATEAATAPRLSAEEIERIVREPGSATVRLREGKIQGVIRGLQRSRWTAHSLRSWIERVYSVGDNSQQRP
jgi:hypothetical protein